MRLHQLGGIGLAMGLTVLGCQRAGGLASGRPTLNPEGIPATSVQLAAQLSTEAATEAAPAAAQPRLLTEEDLRGLSWRSVGPANMSGRVSDIAVAPGDPKTYFIAYGTGGLWKTTNLGVTFTPVFDKYETCSIGAVAVADAPDGWPGWAEEAEEQRQDAAEATKKPRAERGKAKIVWVGTGEGNGRNSSSWGHGVYLSTDGGSSFKHVGLAETQDIPELAVHPGDPDTCFVAAMGHLWGPNPERGVYRTRDRGKTWEPVLQIDDRTGSCDVVIDPQNPDIIYAAMYTRMRTKWSFQSGGPDGGIFRSDDGGTTWKKLTNGLPAETGRIGLDVFQGDSRILYASVESDEGGRTVDAWHNYSRRGGVFRSEDRGESWERMSDLTPRAFYFSRIRVDPKNDQRVYLPGWTVGASDDGGRTFRAGLSRIAHVDFHAMWINPEDTDHLIIGSDGGAYVSFDRGAKWDYLNHMAVGQFYNIAVDLSDPYRVGGGLQDNGSWIGPSATLRITDEGTLGESGYGITNADWQFINGGDGFHVAFDPVDPNIVYAESQGGELVRVHLDTGRRKRLIPAPKEGQPRFRFNWNAPFIISPHDPSVLYHAGNHVFKLTDRGDQWQRISGDLSRAEADKIASVGSEAETHGTIVSLAESALGRGMLWAGTDDGLIHLTRDDGKTWTDVTPPQIDGRYIAEIEPSRHARDRAYVAVDGHRSDDMDPYILMTDDAGATWAEITGDLPKGWSVYVVKEDRRNPDVLYCGTEQGVYLTIDRGRRWVRLNGKSLPTVRVDDLIQHPREFDLVAGTHGRSIYILDDASPLSQLSPEVVASDLHLFEVPDAKPRIYLPYGGLWSHREFRAKNPPMGARITYWLSEVPGEDTNITIEDQHGNTIRELKGSNRAGLNRVIWDLEFEKHDQYGNPEGQARFVPEGEYTVKVSVGDQRAWKKFRVLPSPIDYDR